MPVRVNPFPGIPALRLASPWYTPLRYPLFSPSILHIVHSTPNTPLGEINEHFRKHHICNFQPRLQRGVHLGNSSAGSNAAGLSDTQSNSAPEQGAPPPSSAPSIDVSAILDKLSSQTGEKLDWRRSIVNLN
jgi:hypothetical protein